VLYDQALSPWRLGFELPADERARLLAAGARSDKDGVVTWPGDSLRRFMLGYVLAHELGHHVLQHERRLRGERAARTSEHESRADTIAAKLRALLD
jgi:Zn-dependent peptidase ImmA (M78 family)